MTSGEDVLLVLRQAVLVPSNLGDMVQAARTWGLDVVVVVFFGSLELVHLPEEVQTPRKM